MLGSPRKIKNAVRWPITAGILVIFLGVYVPMHVSPVQATVANACAHAATATNAVIRFYLAIDQRRFASAYQCFSTSEQAHLTYARFVHGYAATLRSTLIYVGNEVPSGAHTTRIAIDLHAVDKDHGHLLTATYMGSWLVSAANSLIHGSINMTQRHTVDTVPTTDVAAVFKYAREEQLAHVHADVTTDGRADDIYITGGIGCGSCHVQRVWIFSQNRLIFSELVNDAEVKALHGGAGFELRATAPDATGPDCCPNQRAYADWLWTPSGFVLQQQHIVRVH